MTNLASVWSITNYRNTSTSLQFAYFSCHIIAGGTDTDNMSLKTISKSKWVHSCKERTQESKTRNKHRQHDKVYTLWRLIRVRHRSQTTHRWTQSGDDRQEAWPTHKRKLKSKKTDKSDTNTTANTLHSEAKASTWTWDVDMRRGQGRGTNRSTNINKYNDGWELKHKKTKDTSHHYLYFHVDADKAENPCNKKYLLMFRCGPKNQNEKTESQMNTKSQP